MTQLVHPSGEKIEEGDRISYHGAGARFRRSSRARDACSTCKASRSNTDWKIAPAGRLLDSHRD
jgi:hypothetical protein